jgi:lipopolysaccharide exporter
MKFTKNSYWLKSGVFTVLERLSVVLFGFGSFYFLVRVFSKEDFGTWTLFLTVTALIEVARNGLIQNAQIKYLASAEEGEHAKIMTASIALNCILTAISVTGLIVFAKLLSIMWDTAALESMFYYYSFTTISLIFLSQFNFIQQANMDFKGIFFSNFVRQGTFFSYVLGSFLFGYEVSLISLVWFQTVGAICGALVSYFNVRKYLQLNAKVDWEWVKKLFHFGKFVFGTNLSAMLFRSIDQLMLGSLSTTASVATYNTAVRISNLVEVPTVSMAAIMFPQSARRMKTEGKDAVRQLYEKSVGLLLTLIVPVVLIVILFSEFIITVIAGDKYLDTVPVLRVTILYNLFMPFSRQFGTVMDSIGMPKVNFRYILFNASLNIVLNYIFISKFGIMGAAYGSLTAHSIAFIVNQVILFKVLNVRFFNALEHTRSFYVTGVSMGGSFIKKKLYGGRQTP